MRVLFATSECVPFFKKGGLGDVSYALPVALSKIGVHAAIAMPYYKAIKLGDVRCVGQLAVSFDGKRELVFIFATLLPHTSVPVYLFRHPLLDDYFGGNDMPQTFVFFDKCVAELYHYSPGVLGGPYDVVHCHDWHTSLIPMLLGENNKLDRGRHETIEAQSVKTILTIHNLLYRGETSAGIIKKLGLPRSLFHIFDTPLGPAVKLLREGLEYTDVISTVSPTYAHEISTTSRLMEDVLAKRKDRVVGILNGIDEGIWDPDKDPFLPVTYTARTVFEAKPTVKISLQQALRLPAANVPLFGFVGRLEDRQKGVGLIADMVEKLPREPFQLAVLGTGSPHLVKRLTELTKKHPHVAFTNTFDERLARRIYAGADIMLVPSKFEPCGLTQMIAMRYGTVPLVRKTGGLADSVIDGKTGFVFGPYTAEALTDRVKQAIDLWTKDQERWHHMVEEVIRQDFSWKASAKMYKALYARLVAGEKIASK